MKTYQVILIKYLILE